MSGHSQFEHAVRSLFLKPDVTAFLAEDDPAVATQSMNDLVIRHAWDLAHTEISTVSVCSLKRESSSTGSR